MNSVISQTSMRPFEILLIEDSEADVDLVREALENLNVSSRLSNVSDGDEAMRYLKRLDVSRPDLILLDLNLPRKDGRECLKEIRNDPELKMIPVVILTTSGQEQDVIRSYQLSANSYVVKPRELSHFFDVIRRIGDFWFETAQLPRSQ